MMEKRMYPKWVRNRYNKYLYEYSKDGQYFAHGFYDTPEEAHEACLKHQKSIEKWKELGHSEKTGFENVANLHKLNCKKSSG